MVGTAPLVISASLAAGARKEVERAERTGASRTARAALGYAELRAGDIEAMKAAHRRFARRQLTWMRRMEGVEPLDVSRRSASQVASEIAASLVPKQE